MKHVKTLTQTDQVILREAWSCGPTARVVQRAHAVYLIAQAFCIPKLVPIFEMDRDTVSGWIAAWERYGVGGLFDASWSGRTPILSECLYGYSKCPNYC